MVVNTVEDNVKIVYTGHTLGCMMFDYTCQNIDLEYDTYLTHICKPAVDHYNDVLLYVINYMFHQALDLEPSGRLPPKSM